MEPDIESPSPETSDVSGDQVSFPKGLPQPAAPPEPPETRFVRRALLGRDGVRAGWSIVLFLIIYILLTAVLGMAYIKISGHGHFGSPDQSTQQAQEVSATKMIPGELISVVALLGATWILALVERRRLTAYYLGGRRPVARFFEGFLGGFAALSALIGGLYLGGWIKFDPVALTGTAIYQNAGMWAIAFLLVGLAEEGTFRCYLLFTLNRGLGSGPRGFFWAALLTSAIFGAVHLSNNGESQIGVVSAAAIGFVFCASIWFTKSAWWAIGFHAAWDWAETFFFGTADSGLLPQGHFLTTVPAGNSLWSGGAVGPEGSLLILPLVLAVLLAIWIIYGRKTKMEAAIMLAPGRLS